MTDPTEKPNVVSLRGEPIRQPGEVIPEVVDELERLLGMARSGEIQGIAIVFIHSDECTGARRRGTQTRGMIGMLEIIKIDMCGECR